MPKLWLVARQAYLREVRRKSFLIAALAPILVVGLVVALVITIEDGGSSGLPMGYVDSGGLLKPEVLPTLDHADEMVALRAFPNEAAARAALEAHEIQAYYVVPADFLAVRTLKGYYLERAPSESARGDLQRFLRASLLADVDEAVRQRANDGVTLIVRTPDGRRSMSMDNPLNFVMPFFAAILFVVTVMMSAGYLLQAVTAEKENRTIEIMVTSSSPKQLIGGKAVGLVGVALTELAMWLATIGIGIVVAAPFVPEIQGYRIPWDLVGVVALYFFPSFVLVAGVMTTIGSLMPDFRQGQQMAGIINLFFVSPLMVSTLLFMSPDHPVLVAMTFFPTTAFAMVALRWSFTQIPVWQMVVSWLLLVASSVGSVLLAARVFRAGMLHYGKPLSLAQALGSLRAAKEAPHA
jgi:ABC-2 type transport system permease protein